MAAEIEVKKAELLKAQQNLKHRHDVIHVKGISLEDYQHAQDDLKATAASLKSTKNNYQKMLAFVQGTSIIEHPWVQAAAQEVRDAWVQLYRCKIYAPVDGLVAQRTIQVGMWVSPNEPLMSIIPLDQMWVNANFKETQLKKCVLVRKSPLLPISMAQMLFIMAGLLAFREEQAMLFHYCPRKISLETGLKSYKDYLFVLH